MRIGDNIKKYRKSNNLTQKNLADLTNLDVKSIGRYERNETTPTINILHKISIALGITLNELLTSETTENGVTRFTSLANQIEGADKPIKITKDDYIKRMINSLKGYYKDNLNDLKAKNLIDNYDLKGKLSDKELGDLNNYLNFINELKIFGSNAYFIPTFFEFNLYRGIEDIIENKKLEITTPEIEALFHKLRQNLESEIYKLENRDTN